MTIVMADIESTQLIDELDAPDIAAFLDAHRRDRQLVKRTAAFRGSAHRLNDLEAAALATGDASTDPDNDPAVQEAIRRLARGMFTAGSDHLMWLVRIVDLARAHRDDTVLQVALSLVSRRYGDFDLADVNGRGEAVKRWTEGSLRAVVGDGVEIDWRR